jgi:hypothetical protein
LFVRASSLLAAGALFGVAACSLLVSTSDLSDGQRGPDGGAGDASLVDGSLTASDAGSPGDAAGDGDARTCSSGGFCDDFDQGALGATWTTKVIEGASSLDFDIVDFQSAPRSLRAKVPARGSESSKAALLRSLAGTPKSLRCSFSIRVNSTARAPTDFIDFFQIRAVGPTLPAYEMRLGLLATKTNVREDVHLDGNLCNCPRKAVDIENLPQSTWTRVTVDTDLASMEISYDGRVVLATPFQGVSYTSLSVYLGLQNFSSVAADVQYDDLVCDVRY